MEKRKKIKWEFKQLSQTGRVDIPKGAIEVRFFFSLSGDNTTAAIINQTYILDSFSKFTSGAQSRYPYELILINNTNEEDVTEYYVKMKPASIMTVIYKYYVNEGV